MVKLPCSFVVLQHTLPNLLQTTDTDFSLRRHCITGHCRTAECVVFLFHHVTMTLLTSNKIKNINNVGGGGQWRGFHLLLILIVLLIPQINIPCSVRAMARSESIPLEEEMLSILDRCGPALTYVLHSKFGCTAVLHGVDAGAMKFKKPGEERFSTQLSKDLNSKKTVKNNSSVATYRHRLIRLIEVVCTCRYG